MLASSHCSVVPVVTCMGRLEQLKQTLPLLTREFERAVLVDWSCPERSGAWATEQFGSAVEVVAVTGESHFHRSRALNCGARRAGELGADWLLFLDADTLVSPPLAVACQQHARPEHFVLGDRSGANRLRGLTGVLLVAKADFARVGGYDEAFTAYGFEDIEMRCRLRLRGQLLPLDLPTGLLHSIPHSEELRVRYYAEKNLQSSERQNFAKLCQLIRSWTGRDISEVPEIQDLLYLEIPRDLQAARELARSILGAQPRARRRTIPLRSSWGTSRRAK